MGFTKLDAGIIESSIWDESAETRVVWITFLARCDENGFVRGTNNTIARAANVPQPAADAAINVLESPDAHSRTPDNDGRRIQRKDGGWLVLNYLAFREKEYQAQRRQQSAKLMAEKRKHEAANKLLTTANNYASASSSASPEGMQGEVTAKTIALEACRVFNKKSHHPPALIVTQCLELLEAHSVADIRRVFAAVEGRKFDFPPQRPDTMTDPGKFDGWLAKLSPLPSSAVDIKTRDKMEAAYAAE